MNINPNITLVPYEPKHYEAFKQLMQHCFNDMGSEFACEKEMSILNETFPEGQILAWHNDQLVGAVISRIVPYEDFNCAHTQDEILDLDRYYRDAEIGNALYGLDIFVHEEFRLLKLGAKLYAAILDACFSNNFSHFLGASRLPCFHLYSEQLSLEEYVAHVKAKLIKDGALSFHLYHQMEVIAYMDNFNALDLNSKSCGVAMARVNPFYNPALPTYSTISKKLLA